MRRAGPRRLPAATLLAPAAASRLPHAGRRIGEDEVDLGGPRSTRATLTLIRPPAVGLAAALTVHGVMHGIEMEIVVFVLGTWTSPSTFRLSSVTNSPKCV
jgi:hypothetical protein